MPKKPVFPTALKPGATIGIVSPARWLPPEGLNKAKKYLEKRGYRVVIHPQNYLRDGQLAGSDGARAGAIMDMFANPLIDAILCARGGCSSVRIVDKLNYKVIARNPKPFIGFSDITIFLNYFAQHCDFVSYHGPMAWNFAYQMHRQTGDDLFSMLENTKKRLTLSFPDIECVRPGKAEGQLIGGNITRLELLMDTAYDWSSKDCILFIEDVDEVLYKIDEKMNHLRLAGRFKNVRAVLVGEMVDIADGENGYAKKGDRPYGRSLQQIFEEQIPAHIPLCINFPCGHGKYLTTLPVGAHTQLTLNANGAKLTFLRS